MTGDKSMMSQSLQDLKHKVAVFKSLDDDHISDGDDQFDEKERQYREKSRAFFPPRKTKSRPLLPTPRRVLSAPTSALPVIKATPGAQITKNANIINKNLSTEPSLIGETPIPDTVRPGHPSLQRRATVPLTASVSAVEQSPSMSSSLKKRKRQTSLANVIPESDKVFRDLAFYYIPDNDIAPARKLRIARAREYGARWIRSLAEASHVIVDKHLTFKDIQPVLGSVSPSSVTIVNEEYPIDCISFRTLLNPNQFKYRISGCPVPATSPPPGPTDIIPSSQASDRSLPLKEPQRDSRKWDHGLRKATPPRSEQSTPHDAVEADNEKRPLDEETNARELSQNVPDNDACLPTSRSRAEDNTPDRPESQRLATSSHQDDLSDYIQLMQQYKDLPLDIEDDDLQSVADAQDTILDSDVEGGSEDERARKRRSTRSTRSGQKEIAFEDRFACNKGGTKNKPEDAQNPNARTIEILQRMCDYYTRINDHWRTTAYRKVISTLRRQTTKITTENQAFSLPNIGRRLAMKIEEIVNTDKLKRLEYANDEPLDQVLELFLKIYDVGTSRANKWISQGFRTLEDLKEKASLTTNQRIGIDHFDDLNTRIPRAEVTALGEYVKKEAAKLDPDVELLVGGSYRRGSDSSGDIDFIVTKKDTSSSSELVPFLQELIGVLTKKGFIVATLAALHADRQSRGKDGPGSKWHGCCVLPPSAKPSASASSLASTKPIWRRIDFLLVPETEYGAALIYFTGNDIFNRSMRLLASKKGMRLNQRGLYREVMRGRGRVKVTEGGLVEGRDEKRIFEILGVQWREPWERWC